MRDILFAGKFCLFFVHRDLYFGNLTYFLGNNFFSSPACLLKLHSFKELKRENNDFQLPHRNAIELEKIIVCGELLSHWSFTRVNVALKASIVSFGDPQVYFVLKFFLVEWKFMRSYLLPSYYKIYCHLARGLHKFTS